MYRSELLAAVNSAQESVRREMKNAGYGSYIAEIEQKIDYVEIVQLALQAAEEARHKVEREEKEQKPC